MSSKFVFLSISSLLLASPLAANAMIVPVDGTIQVYAAGSGGHSNVPDLTFGAAYGQYTSAASEPLPTEPGTTGGGGYASVTAKIQSQGINIAGNVGGCYCWGGLGTGQSFTTLRFTLTEADNWLFKAYPDPRGTGTLKETFTLSNEVGTLFSVSCEGGNAPGAPTDICYRGHAFHLDAGLYTLTLNIVNAGYSGPLSGGTMTLSMGAPVPVPAALPLFGGALAGLGLLRRRRSRPWRAASRQ